MIKLISISLLISFFVVGCDTKELKQKILINITDTSLLYLLNFKIDSVTINTFLNKHNISDSIKFQVNQFYKIHFYQKMIWEYISKLKPLFWNTLSRF